MSQLSLSAQAEFQHTVYIPIPGGEPAPLQMTYKARGHKETQAFIEKHGESWTADTVLDCAVGWGLPDAFTRENVAILLDLYPMAAARIIGGYLDEIYNARVKN